MWWESLRKSTRLGVSAPTTGLGNKCLQGGFCGICEGLEDLVDCGERLLTAPQMNEREGSVEQRFGDGFA